MNGISEKLLLQPEVADLKSSNSLAVLESERLQRSQKRKFSRDMASLAIDR